ncbi:hypothetical protein PPL_01726 [Heterostelium album PN500]|uniref:Uncharacterized protein n=1 Tax=Heterostelium pallidum (strain ATCC 26659 / Pp 5 / PN500) TaxID=670386 RepID=D3B0B0_HETP5|nr:hypothetical protein PPL_01726 [Heterostelium album PN500]EFA84734.1 hypothetical protein PPL_01726 [Heterostelium album PN500]|eukprot:XP_020436846.1 hypothetical protein PPL_01726 [Heterostelium album PN500]
MKDSDSSNNYIPWFINVNNSNNENNYSNSNSNSNKDDVNINNSVKNTVLSPTKKDGGGGNSGGGDISILSCYKYYQSVFDQLSQSIALWNGYDGNQATALNSVAVCVDRLQLIMNNENLQNRHLNTLQFSHFPAVNKQQQQQHRHGDGDGDDEQIINEMLMNKQQQPINQVIMNELKLRHCQRIEELMRSLLRYNESKRKIIEKMTSLAFEFRQHYNKYIETPILLDTKYTKQLDFNSGTPSDHPLSNLYQWIHYIIHSFKQEFLRKDELIKKINYTNQEELSKIIDDWDNQTLIDQQKVREYLSLANGAIKDD